MNGMNDWKNERRCFDQLKNIWKPHICSVFRE